MTGALLAPEETSPPWLPSRVKLRFFFSPVYLWLRVIEWVTKTRERENASLANDLTSNEKLKEKEKKPPPQLLGG